MQLSKIIIFKTDLLTKFVSAAINWLYNNKMIVNLDKFQSILLDKGWSDNTHCLKSERIRRFFRIQSKCWKIRTRKTPNMDTFPAVKTIEVEIGSEKTKSYSLHFLYKGLQSGLSPQICEYFQDFQGPKLLKSRSVVWPNKQILSVF